MVINSKQTGPTLLDMLDRFSTLRRCRSGSRVIRNDILPECTIYKPQWSQIKKE